ncbi:MAG TPA: hypothetical protein DCR93_15285 [Cytophagales bacterium]|nr:hypothetical protein [Cytophagales bacterium]
MKPIYQLIFSSILLLLGLYAFKNDLRTELQGAGLGGLVYLIVMLINKVISNRRRLRFILGCLRLSVLKQKIRFSMAYLYLIRVDGEYLLIKNEKQKNYQPVGGKYKFLPGASQKISERFSLGDDETMPANTTNNDDIAVMAPALRAVAFEDWFNSGEDRETSHWREFYEELVEGKGERILEPKNFPHIMYRKITRVITPLHWDEYFKCYTRMHFDILELIPNEEQLKELKATKTKTKNSEKGDYFEWFSIRQILSLGYDPSDGQTNPIAKHTKWAIEKKYSKVK